MLLGLFSLSNQLCFLFNILTILSVFYIVVHAFYASEKIWFIIEYLLFNLLVIIVVLGVVQFKV
jgi:hypothetical protein